MTNRRYAGRILMIRNKSLGKRLLAAGIMLIFSMSGCGTDNEIELTGNGIGSDGIEAAARGYFGKSASELSVSQQAFIAAIPNNPTKYNPLTNYDATITRRNLILK
mgnify:CR=1 FL=1